MLDRAHKFWLRREPWVEQEDTQRAMQKPSIHPLHPESSSIPSLPLASLPLWLPLWALCTGASLFGIACVSAGSGSNDGMGGDSNTSVGGSTGTGGTGASTSTGTGGGTAGVAGTAGVTGTAGAAGATGGRTGTGGAGTVMGTGGATAGTGGAPPFTPPFTCTIPTWPTPTGTPVSITATRSITGTYDGKMALHNGSGSGDFVRDCAAAGTGAQGTTNALFELANGATIQNVIIGNHGADGIHCLGTCTIRNVWFQNVCDDAVTAVEGSSGTVTVDGGGMRGAHDKLFQDNSHGKFIIQNFYGEKLGKMYRACGEGGACGTTKGNLTITNTIAIGVDELVGVTQGRDTATISKLCVFQTPTVCQPYDSSDNRLPTDGPDGTTCKYSYADVQVMLDHVVPAGFTSGAACPNFFKSSSTTATGTACVATLPACLKYCAPGSNGVKQCNCLNGSYSCKGCAAPALEPAKSGLSPTLKLPGVAACSAANGDTCSTEWNWCTLGTQDCVCVYKPGTLQQANTVWDCVNPWY
jgi:pectate lyase